MTRYALPLLAASLLASSTQAAIAIANPASDRLAQLSVLQRKAALRAALLDSGFPCLRVHKTNIQGPWKNMVMWRVQCDGDPRYDYAVFVGPDASIQARYCAEMAELKLPTCRPFGNKPPAPIILGKVPPAPAH